MVGETVPEQINLDLQNERDAIDRLNHGIALCVEVGDNGSRDLLEDILDGEEEHADWLETQLEPPRRRRRSALPRPADARRRLTHARDHTVRRAHQADLARAIREVCRTCPRPRPKRGWRSSAGLSRPASRSLPFSRPGQGARGRRTSAPRSARRSSRSPRRISRGRWPRPSSSADFSTHAPNRVSRRRRIEPRRSRSSPGCSSESNRSRSRRHSLTACDTPDHSRAPIFNTVSSRTRTSVPGQEMPTSKQVGPRRFGPLYSSDAEPSRVRSTFPAQISTAQT